MFSDTLLLETEYYFLNTSTGTLYMYTCLVWQGIPLYFSDSLLWHLGGSPSIPGYLAQSGFCLLSWLSYEDTPFIPPK